MERRAGGRGRERERERRRREGRRERRKGGEVRGEIGRREEGSGITKNYIPFFFYSSLHLHFIFPILCYVFFLLRT